MAVRHGRSEAGNDHVHLVVNLVREDGKVASTRNDFKRLSALCADMERRYGLSAVEGRAKKAAMPGLTRAETEKARRTGRDEAERAELARVVRAAATVAGSEAEFVRLLRDAGLAARPRYDRVGGHRVVGYAVAEEPSDGGVAVFFGGGKLARDLSLPALRDRWRAGEAESQDAAAEWAGAAPATGVHEAPRASRHLTYRWAEASERWGKTAPREEHQASAQRSPAGWRKAPEGLGEVVRRLGAVPAEDVTTWRAVASDAAGALAVLSGRLERSPGRSPVPRASWPARPKGPARASEGPAMSLAAPSSRWPPSWPKRTSTRTRRPPGGFSWPRCSGWPRRSTTPTWRARNPSRLAAWPTRHGRPWRSARARLGSLEALRAELPAVVEAAHGEAGRGEEEAAKRRRRQAGKGALRPEQFAGTTTRRAPPKRSSEVGR